MLFIGMTGPEGASLDYMDRHARMVEDIMMREVEGGEVVRANVRIPGGFGGANEMNQARGFVVLAPWGERERSADQIAQAVRMEMNKIAGVRAFVGAPGGWVRGGGSPVQVVLGGTDYAELAQWRDVLMQRMQANPGLSNVLSNYEERKPQMRVTVDRDRAADLGISLQTVGRTLETVLGSRIVTTFIDRDREYNVILQGRAEDRATPQDLDNLYVRSDRTGELIPLSNLVQLTEVAGPTQLNRFDRLRSITISAALTPGLHARRRARVRRGRRGAKSCRRRRDSISTASRASSRTPAASSTSCSCSRWWSCSWCWPRSSRASCTRS